MPTTWGDAFVVHDIGQVQLSWVNLFSASVTCNKSTLFFIKWLRDPGGRADHGAELLSKHPCPTITHISRHPFWEITGFAYIWACKLSQKHITCSHSPLYVCNKLASFPWQRNPVWNVSKTMCCMKKKTCQMDYPEAKVFGNLFVFRYFFSFFSFLFLLFLG